MINELTYAKKIRKSGGMLLIPIPKEIQEKMNLSDQELIEITIHKKENIQEG